MKTEAFAGDHAHELVLHFIRSPVGIRWSSPRVLGVSTLVNTGLARSALPGHGIGHVNVELLDRKKGLRLLSGITVHRKADQIAALLKDQIGLGVLFHRFEGRLEAAEQISKNLDVARNQGRLRSLRIFVSPEGFERCRQYHEEFYALKHPLEYGFPSLPRKKEGAGCTAFAISYLEVGGLLAPEFSAWRRQIHVPEELIGGKLKVPVWKILASPVSGRWALPSSGRLLDFWDPDLMFQWAKKCQDLNFVMDMRKSPAPTDPIWAE